MQLTQEIKEYLRNTNSLKQRINRFTGNQKMALFNMKGEYDADDIMNNAKKDDDDNPESTQTGTD